VFEQHFDVHRVVRIGVGGVQPGAGGLDALAQVVPQVNDFADHLQVDERHMEARGLPDLVLAGVRLETLPLLNTGGTSGSLELLLAQQIRLITSVRSRLWQCRCYVAMRARSKSRRGMTRG
jgi:hypothetical protein